MIGKNEVGVYIGTESLELIKVRSAASKHSGQVGAIETRALDIMSITELGIAFVGCIDGSKPTAG